MYDASGDDDDEDESGSDEDELLRDYHSYQSRQWYGEDDDDEDESGSDEPSEFPPDYHSAKRYLTSEKFDAYRYFHGMVIPKERSAAAKELCESTYFVGGGPLLVPSIPPVNDVVFPSSPPANSGSRKRKIADDLADLKPAGKPDVPSEDDAATGKDSDYSVYLYYHENHESEDGDSAGQDPVDKTEFN
jgi:hypothetical protein